MVLTELPFELPGQVYRSPMPFGQYDPEGLIFPAYKNCGISVVVLLAEEDECLKKAKRSLKAFYEREGWAVIHSPIPDFGIPDQQQIKTTMESTIDYAQVGRHVAVHCSAGRGRTGLFVALLARKVFGLSGEQAFTWTRQHIPDAVDTPEQKAFVTSFIL